MNLLYFSPVPWHGLPHRPHHLVRFLLTRGFTRVVWVNPVPVRYPTWRDILRRPPVHGGALSVPDGLQVVTPRCLPLEPHPVGRWVNRIASLRATTERLFALVGSGPVVGIGRPSQLAMLAVERMRPARVFYDAMDDMPAFYRGSARRYVEETERHLAAMSDLAIASSSALEARFAGLTPVVHRVLNACDVGALPARWHEPVRRRTHGATIGYVGTIGGWFDWGVVVALARQAPGVTFEIVGPCHAPPPRRVPANVRVSGALPHPEAMARLASWDAGLIPFVHNRVTASVDPIKYYEYRAMGLAVLSTRFGEMAGRGWTDGVVGADAPGAVPRVLSVSLETDVEAFRREHDWAVRFASGRVVELLR